MGRTDSAGQQLHASSARMEPGEEAQLPAAAARDSRQGIFQELDRRRKGPHAKSNRTEQTAQRAKRERVIVDDEYCRLLLNGNRANSRQVYPHC